MDAWEHLPDMKYHGNHTTFGFCHDSPNLVILGKVISKKCLKLDF